MATPLLEVKGLKTYFYAEDGTVRALDGVEFEAHPGEVPGIAGESGCGKSVTLLSIMRLIAAPGMVEHISGPHLKRERIILNGAVPSPLSPPSGCRFHLRCLIAEEYCSQKEPDFRQVSPDHWVACCLVEPTLEEEILWQFPEF